MAIVGKPKRNQIASEEPNDEKAAEAFISGAANAAVKTETEAAVSKRTPVMIRFDSALLEKVDDAAKRRGISRSAWGEPSHRAGRRVGEERGCHNSPKDRRTQHRTCSRLRTARPCRPPPGGD